MWLLTCSRLHLSHFSVHDGDSSRCSEEIVKIPYDSFQCDYYYLLLLLNYLLAICCQQHLPTTQLPMISADWSSTMATAAAVDQDSDSDTEDFNADSYVRCPVCLDYYKEPKVLTCGHLVCCQCLVNWMTANVLPTTCPVCRANLTGDETGRYG